MGDGRFPCRPARKEEVASAGLSNHLTGALGALPLQEDFGDVPEGRTLGPLGWSNLHLDVRQAGDGAAVRADEVRVLSSFMGVPPAHLEPPGMIPRVQSRQQAGIGEFHQAAVERGLVKTRGNKLIRHFGMAERLIGRGQMLQHGNSRGRAPQLGRAEGRAGVFYGYFLIGRTGHA